MKEYESFERIGVEPHRSYYIPFAPNDKIKNKFGIIDRRSSSRFVSLDGVWHIKQHNHISEVDIHEALTETIPVPARLRAITRLRPYSILEPSLSVPCNASAYS